jgi:hypothetical protein
VSSGGKESRTIQERWQLSALTLLSPELSGSIFDISVGEDRLPFREERYHFHQHSAAAGSLHHCFHQYSQLNP